MRIINKISLEHIILVVNKQVSIAEHRLSGKPAL